MAKYSVCVEKKMHMEYIFEKLVNGMLINWFKRIFTSFIKPFTIIKSLILTPAFYFCFLLLPQLVSRRFLIGKEETQLTKLLKPIRTQDPDQNLPRAT